MYKPAIGLEIHIELKTESKMFCSCLNDPNEKHPNVNICPVCTAQPGTLPVINKEAVRKVVKTGLALGCNIQAESKFDRKNYFYPDLPKGYQISQYDKPICKEGFLEVDGKKIRITRVHLEEDTGRLIHEKDHSLVDFNRAGVPLMELVTEPDISSAKEARKFAEELRLILRYLGVSEADMEKGLMRIEVNLSLSEKAGKLGTKVEIKNLNSFRSVEKGIDYEIKRQGKELESGRKIVQETRGWHDSKEITFSQREKEESHDYRYFPEPDLPPLHFNQQFIEGVKAEIPELPQARRERLKREYSLGPAEVEIFVQQKDIGEYFEKVISELGPDLAKDKLEKLTKLSANYIISDLLGILRGASVVGEDFLISPENFAELVNLIYDNKVSGPAAKAVLKEMFAKGGDPSHIIKERGLGQITDQSEIESIIKGVLSNNQKAVEDFRKGKANAFQYLIGQIMAKSHGKANPKIVEKVLRENLDK